MLKKFANKENQNRKTSDILNVVQIKPGINVLKDNSKDALLTEFGKLLSKIDICFLMKIIKECLPGVASYFSDTLSMPRDYMITCLNIGLCLLLLFVQWRDK